MDILSPQWDELVYIISLIEMERDYISAKGGIRGYPPIGLSLESYSFL
jgi:hypothetical protein